ncbi:alpha/beta fold hydrolase, partial [Streptomyces zaomyceticus]
MGHPVRTDDGRVLVAEEWGNPSGAPVVLFHGTPGTRLGTLLPGLAEQHPGFRFLAYDRPGYGESRRVPGRRVADAARDAAAVADAFGVERFAVVGR